MPTAKKSPNSPPARGKRAIEQYTHDQETRVNNPPVGLVDTDYDGRSLFPRQVFFPMAGDKEGWAKLAKILRAEIDEAMIEAYRGTLSVPFELGKHRRVAVKIVDDRGIESLKIVHVVTRAEYEQANKQS